MTAWLDIDDSSQINEFFERPVRNSVKVRSSENRRRNASLRVQLRRSRNIKTAAHEASWFHA